MQSVTQDSRVDGLRENPNGEGDRRDWDGTKSSLCGGDDTPLRDSTGEVKITKG